MEEEEKALLGLNTVPGLGPAGLARMVASAGGAVALAREPDALLEEIATLEVEGRVLRRPGGIYHRCGPTAPD